MATGINDRFANIASIVGNIAISGLTFTELLSGVSLGQGLGMIIDQIDYYLSAAAWQELDADGDFIQIALVTSNSINDIPVDNKSVVHQTQITRLDGGTAGNFVITVQPLSYKFTPPIIVATPRLYMATSGANISATREARMRIFYRYIKLTTQEYLELAESFVLVG